MKRIVIIGGGFAGTYIARKLEEKFDVILIDSKDYFEYTPGILRVLIEPKHMKKVQAFHKDYLKKAKVIVGCVTEINTKEILMGRKRISFDYLAVCSGSKYNFPIKEQDAIIAARVRHLKKSHSDLHKARKILIIGGGLVGVELAGEIMQHYRNKKVIIIHSKKHLIPRNNPRTIKYVERFLQKKGVQLILNDKVVGFKNKRVSTQLGKKINADMIFLSTGIIPNFEFMERYFSKALNERNQIIVNENLQVNGHDNIFAAGDITNVNEEKTAQNADRQAATVVKNICALEFGKSLEKYHFRKTALVISLGKYNGILEYKNFVLGGKIPALMKWMIEKGVMWQH